MLPFNKPIILVFVAVLGSSIAGALQPTFSIFFSKLLGILSMPMEWIPAVTREEKLGWIEVELKFWVSWMCVCALAAIVGPFL